MSTSFSQSHPTQSIHSHSQKLIDTSSSLQQRIPLDYSLCLEKLKGAPIQKGYKSSFSPYIINRTFNYIKKQSNSLVANLPELKSQVASRSQNQYVTKIQNHLEKSQQSQESINIFKHLKMKQNKEQNEQNADFVRTKGDIVFAKCINNPLWPCQIKVIERIPGLIPQILYYVKFINQNTYSWINFNQIVSFTTQNCQYVKKYIKDKKLTKAIKMATKKALSHLSKIKSKRTIKQNSQSTQQNQKLQEKQTTEDSNQFFYAEIISNNEGFYSMKKSIVKTPQLVNDKFQPIIVKKEAKRQRSSQLFLQQIKQEANLEKLNSVNTQGKKEKIPRIIKIIGYKKIFNMQQHQKITLEFKKQKKSYSKQIQLSKSHMNSIKIKKQKQIAKNLTIETPKISLSFFQRIQNFNKKHLKNLQKRYITSQQKMEGKPLTAKNSNNWQENPQNKQSKNQYSRYQQDSQFNSTESIKLQIQYEKNTKSDEDQTLVQFRTNSFELQGQETLLNEKRERSLIQSCKITNQIPKIKGQNKLKLTKEQQLELVKDIKSYNDQLFKIKKIENKQIIQESIISKICKISSQNLAYSQIIDQLCMMTGLMKKQIKKNPQYYFFYKQILQKVQLLITRVTNQLKQDYHQQHNQPYSINLKIKTCVENKLWLLTNCLSSKENFKTFSKFNT